MFRGAKLELAPVPGLRTVSTGSPLGEQQLLRPPLAIEESARAGDDAYTASRQTPDRGLEDEESTPEEECEIDTKSDAQHHPASRIDLII